MRPRHASVESALALTPELATRARTGAWIVFAWGVPFLLADALVGQPNFAEVLVIEATQMVILLGFIWWLHLPHPEAAVRRATLGVVSAVYALTAASSAMRGDLVGTCFELAAAVIATGGFLPWGAWTQAASLLVASTALAANAALVPPLDGQATIYPALGILSAFAGSLWVASEAERERSARRRAAALLGGQTQVLELMARGVALPTVLDGLCTMVEAQTPGLHCTVLRLDGDRLYDVAGPSVPLRYRQTIDGIRIGPEVGCCGTAAYLRRIVTTSDIATDPRWAEFRSPALAEGYRACWSAPILAADGECLGAFAMYYSSRRRPTSNEERLLDTAAHLAGLALARARDEAELSRSGAQLSEESQVSRALLRVAEGILSSLDTPRVLRDLCRLARSLVGCEGVATVLRDGEARTATVTADTAHGPWPLDGFRLPEGTVTALLARLEGRPLMRLYPDASDPLTAQLWHYVGARRALAAPLHRGRGSEPIGVLLLADRTTEAAFTPLQQRIASGIAKLGSLALENAFLVEQLRTATAAKSEFVSTISHELRTPISVILGYTEMLDDGDLPGGERRSLVRRVRRTSHELLELVQATLDLSRLEAGRDGPHLEPVAVHELLAEVAGDFAAIARDGAATLRWEPGPPFECRSDSRKLRIIVKNLVGNALKFTPSGSVTVRYRVAPGLWELEVEDTGIGIPADHLNVIFEMFRQGDGSDRRTFGGVGLGLYLVRRLATQLGGTVRVSSQPGRGSTFTVALPLGTAPALGMLPGVDRAAARDGAPSREPALAGAGEARTGSEPEVPDVAEG